jgi:hypothetical protein
VFTQPPAGSESPHAPGAPGGNTRITVIRSRWDRRAHLTIVSRSTDRSPPPVGTGLKLGTASRYEQPLVAPQEEQT